MLIKKPSKPLSATAWKRKARIYERRISLKLKKWLKKAPFIICSSFSFCTKPPPTAQISVTKDDLSKNWHGKSHWCQAAATISILQANRDKFQEQLHNLALDRKIKQFLISHARWRINFYTSEMTDAYGVLWLVTAFLVLDLSRISQCESRQKASKVDASKKFRCQDYSTLSRSSRSNTACQIHLNLLFWGKNPKGSLWPTNIPDQHFP